MRHRQSARQYPRTARVNELLREILADSLERLDDDRLVLLTVTGVECEADLRRARVFYDNLDGPDGDEAVLEALAELRPRLQAAINREARLKRTPELSFLPDPAVRTAARLEAVLRDVQPAAGQVGEDPAAPGAAGGEVGVLPEPFDGVEPPGRPGASDPDPDPTGG